MVNGLFGGDWVFSGDWRAWWCSRDCGVLWSLEIKHFYRHYGTLNPRLACSDNARQDQELSDTIHRAEQNLAMKSDSEIRAPRLLRQ